MKETKRKQERYKGKVRHTEDERYKQKDRHRALEKEKRMCKLREETKNSGEVKTQRVL